MARLALIIVGGTLVLCVACAALVVVYWRKAETSVSTEIAHVITTQVEDNIGASALKTGQVVLTEDDLDINTVTSLDGSCGFNVINSDAEIYGVTTEITTTEIAFGCIGAEYSAVPVIQDDRVVLTNIAASNGVTNFIFSKEKLKKGFEAGINDALAAKGVKPTGITLKNGSMTILMDDAKI